MPDNIRRRDFVQALENKTLTTSQAEGDPALRNVLPAKADLDKNGVISGRAEADALFTQIDSFGRNPGAQSLALTTPDGHATDAARAIAALGKLTGSEEVMGWTAGLDFDAARDWSTYVAPAGTQGTPQGMLGAAGKLLRERADNYGTHQPWFNLDPNHALPTNKPLTGLAANDRHPDGVWKCNLFGGNALYLAGFEPPYYGNKGHGEYPNANQFWKFSDKYARQFGNKVHFEMVGEVDLTQVPFDQKDAQVAKLLQSVRPGDLLMVDHPGDGVADGGHTRVVLSNDMTADGKGTISSAQATATKAAVRAEGLSSFTGEEHVWILRPNRPRGGQPVRPQPAPSPSGNGTYKVAAGDTLSKIAQKLLGDSSKWPELLKANPQIKDPRKIQIGMTLKLP